MITDLTTSMLMISLPDIHSARGCRTFARGALAILLLSWRIPSADAQRAPADHQSHGAVAATPADRPIALLDNLGNWHRRIVTSAPLAQRYFDQGLRQYYAFNQAEAVRAFREAQRLDPRCVMCVWGEAMALGPNINTPMDAESERQAVAATARALELIKDPRVDENETRWVQSLVGRYLGSAQASRAVHDSVYAVSMMRIVAQSPNDADALSLAAEAMMTLSPWTYWTTDGTARAGTPNVLNWLERAMTLAPNHPGACHFYIHAVEATHASRALPCAERLASLMPGAGHLVHMPAHVYIRVGRWADAIDINRRAVRVDDEYFDGPHATDDALYASSYRAHNQHFLTLAAVMAGASRTAIAASRDLAQIITADVAKKNPSAQPMLAVPVQTLLTFGRWDEVLNAPLPPSTLRVALALTWHARGIAFAASDRAPEARATIDSIRAVLNSGTDAGVDGETRTVLQIAALTVEGEIALRGGDAPAAVRAFGRAVTLEDGLSYMEPPTWFYPVRHSLGKALLAMGKAREAEQVYRADLYRFPENVWSLRGLAIALAAQGRADAAREVERRVTKASRLSDVPIASSRY